MTEIVADKRRPSWLWPVVALALGVTLLGASIAFLALRYDRYAGPSQVMAPTLDSGGVVVVARQDQVHRGDIVLFNRSAWVVTESNGPTAFRVVGLGGDEVVCCDQDKRIQVNGHAITEGYVRFDAAGGDAPREPLEFRQKVPDDAVFLLGDWRTNSAYGPVPRNAIIGTVVAQSAGTLLPPSSLTPPSAFTDAGLAGVSAVDRMVVYAWRAMVAGVVWSLLALVWVIVVGSLRSVRPAPATLPPLPAPSH